ncbi:MAG: hypothetical protein IPI58_04610 [Alphaproteobacteria bacterium]|nr:MAG: hypothetical protein IPI58_04610 [Alphaproteobacteria bacterium]
MSQSPSISSKRKNPLFLIADLMALAILRKKAKEMRASEFIQLDFTAKGSVCDREGNIDGECAL